MMLDGRSELRMSMELLLNETMSYGACLGYLSFCGGGIGEYNIG